MTASTPNVVVRTTSQVCLILLADKLLHEMDGHCNAMEHKVMRDRNKES